MNIKVAHILDQMLEDKTTQTTIRTYIKVTTHSPTHRHIHILAHTQADIMTKCNWLQRLKSVTSKCGPDIVLNGTEWQPYRLCHKRYQLQRICSKQIKTGYTNLCCDSYASACKISAETDLLMKTCTMFQWNTATV